MTAVAVGGSSALGGYGKPGSAVIEDFRGPHAFLSNYAERALMVDGVSYRSVEHAFAAAKTLDDAQAAWVRAAATPGDAKSRGRRVVLRPDWEQVKDDVMRACVAAKFANPGLRAQLLATGDALLVEGNRWHDQQWGDCGCGRPECELPGANMLGLALMRARADIRGVAGRWPRAALTGHRALPSGQQSWVQDALPGVLRILREQHGTVVGISGLALGADALWATSVLEADLALWAYVPFEAQAAKWEVRDQARWAVLRDRASRERVLGQDYDVRLLHARNALMVRDADVVVAVHDPAQKTGGTASTIRLARAAGRPLIRLNVAERTITEIPGVTRS